MDIRISALAEAKADVDRAQKRLVETLADLFSEGSPVQWKRGEHYQTGVVTMNSEYNDRVRVRNDATGREYWITAYDILEGAH